MAPLIWWLSVAICARLGLAVTGSGSTDGVTCSESDVSTNLFANPSWEDGTSSWTYNFVPQTTNAYASDGSYSVYHNGPFSSWGIYQTVQNLVPGSTYQFSIDILPYVNPASSMREMCNLYLYHTSALTTNVVASKLGQYYSSDTNQWVTLSGSYTATSSSDLFGVLMGCSPYITNTIFNVYLDNAKLITTTTTQVCTTVTPTSTPTPSNAVTSVASSSVTPVSSSAFLSLSSRPIIPSSITPSSTPTPTPSASSMTNIASTSSVPTASSLAASSPSSGLIMPSSPSVKLSTTLRSSTATYSSPALQPTSPVSRSSSVPVIPGSSSTRIIPSSSPAVASAPPSTAVTLTHTSAQPTMIPSSSQVPPTQTPSPSVVESSSISSLASSLSTASSGSITTSSAVTYSTGVAMTTSIIYSTRTSTVAACPSTVTDCPVRSRTTYVTTETLYVSTTVCPVAGSGSRAQATASITEVPTGSSGQPQPVEQYTTSVFSTRTATITACPFTAAYCPASARITFITTETVFASTTVCPITGSPSATGTANSENPSLLKGNPVVSVSPLFSTRTATITSCPSDVTDCPATEVAIQIATETLLVGESTYTLPEAALTYSLHNHSPSFSRPFSDPGLSGNFIPTSAEYSYSTGIIIKSTLSSSTTPIPFTTSTTEAVAPLFTGVGSFSHRASWIPILVSFAMASLVLIYL